MTLRAQLVNNYLTDRGQSPICDRCLNEALRMGRYSSSPGNIAATLATTSEFSRGIGVCAVCGERREVSAAAG